MWKDEIVEEVRRIREENAAKFNHDLKAICDDAVKRQKLSGRKVVSFPPRKPATRRVTKPMPKETRS